MATKKQPKETEQKLLERKEAAEAAVKDLDLDALQEMLEVLKEYEEAGMELQLYGVMKESELSREKVLEKIALEGSLHGFDMMDDADAFDLENWMQGVRALNEVLSSIFYQRAGVLAGAPFQKEAVQDDDEEDEDDDELDEE